MEAEQPDGRAGPVLGYDGTVGDLYGIFWFNVLLTPLTLGIYRFWGITHNRQYLWAHTTFMGDRFEYTGTGGEKFRAVLLALLFLVVLGLAIGAISLAAETTGQSWLTILVFPLNLFVAALAGAAVYTAQRYRLSRTRWRGIRGAMTKGALAYGWRTVSAGVLTGVSLGMAWPILRMRLLERRINAIRFGDAAASVRVRASGLYGPFFIGVALKLVFLALIGLAGWLVFDVEGLRDDVSLIDGVQAFLFFGSFWVFSLTWKLADSWFDAAAARLLLRELRLADLRFDSDLRGAELFRLRLVNLAITVGLLGLGRPIVRHLCARFVVRHVRVLGSLDAAGLGQNAFAPPSRGEGLLDLLDAGIAG